MLLLGLLLLGLTVAAGAQGRLLAGLAAALCLVAAGRDLLLRPVLVVGPSGLRVRRGLRLQDVPWDGLERARVGADRGAALLELDLGDDVVLLPRGRLGVHPAEALDAVRGAAPPGWGPVPRS